MKADWLSNDASSEKPSLLTPMPLLGGVRAPTLPCHPQGWTPEGSAWHTVGAQHVLAER